MIAELGQFALALALAMAIAQIGLAYLAASNHNFVAISVRAAHLQALLLGSAFLLLIVLFLQSDFSVALVAAHSHSTKPWFYKIAASWGNHEGSLLLWVLFLTLSGSALAALMQRELKIKSYALVSQAFICSLFLGFLLFASNPFSRLDPAPVQGAGLNPILQDFALIIHPPILYAGTVGFSIAFSLAVAALWARRVDSAWVRTLKLPATIAWSALTVGIALGAWWAYRELGWGGFWFWDPVENAALMPWLIATALIHAITIAAKRPIALQWVVLLAIFSFLFAILGTFLTRSGIITSVHSFASDPLRGIALLAILFLLTLISLFLFFLRRPHVPPVTLFFASREAAIMANSLFLASATAAVLTGTIYPILLEALTTQKIAAGPPYFQASFVPIMIPLLLLMPIAPFLTMQARGHTSGHAKGQARGQASAQRFQKLAFYLAPSAVIAVCAFFLWQPRWSLAAFGIALAVWLIAGASTRLWIRRGVRRKNLLPELPMISAHAGLGILLLGIIGTSSAQLEQTYALVPEQQISFAHYQITFEKIRTIQAPDYRAEQAEISIYRKQNFVASLKPEIRYYIARPQPTRESAIYTDWWPPADLHAILGDPSSHKRTIKFYYNPLAPLLWIGAMFIALGGLLSCLRRFL